MRIPVLCTGNRCRSQMAEAWLRHYARRRAELFSAGTEPKGVHPLAIEVMREAAVDISHHTSDHVDQYADDPFDVVITVCDRARDACPTFHNAGRVLHRAFEDPDSPDLPTAQLRDLFRRIRNDIRQWARDFVERELPAAGIKRLWS